MAISMLKIRRPLGRLIFNMGIAISGKTVFLIETAPWLQIKQRNYIYIYEKIERNECSLIFFQSLPSANQAKGANFMIKQSTLKQADIPHTNRVRIKKDVNVDHVWQYKDKGMCNRLGVIGIDVDADVCMILFVHVFIWKCDEFMKLYF